jgi:two-component system, LytTR family, response regulator LytT
MMKILIIEDEPFARAELIRLLKETGRDFQLLDEIDTVRDSVAWLRSHSQPDLIFLDIQLADGLSFDIFRQVSVSSPVIFTTAYDEYAIKAFQVNSIDYLLKPVKMEALESALRKLDGMRAILGTQQSFPDPKLMESLLRMVNRTYKTRLLLKTGDQIRSVEIEEVAYFYAEEDVVFAMLRNKSRAIVDYTLNQLENELDPKLFHRITRGCIARITAIKKVSKYFNSRLLVELDPPTEEKLLVSRVNVPEVMRWLGE